MTDAKKRKKTIALLSNVNIDPIANRLRDEGLNVWTPDGYGDVIGALANPVSGLPDADVLAVFVFMDTTALLTLCRSKVEAEAEIDCFFASLEANLPVDSPVFVSDAICRYDPYCGDYKTSPSREVEAYWLTRLVSLAAANANVFILPVSTIAVEMGTDSFFSEKMWYLARMPHTFTAQMAVAHLVSDCVQSDRVSKKVLAVDLDNTLWGGVVGELGSQGIELSDERLGLAYKEAQREILNMKDAGVVLVVVSKNNWDDGMGPFKTNGHMLLHEDDITAFKMNWERKDENICALAKELNLGIDSFVFLDDNVTERELVVSMLPEVAVISFPDDPVQLPAVLRDTYRTLFRMRTITDEDRRKTQQYVALAQRSALERESTSYDDYLRGLELEVKRVDAQQNIIRIAQLIGKTNQFNLTTRRHSQQAIQHMIDSSDWEVYAFDVCDRFGDNGITAILLLDFSNETPYIDTFVMSCRIMGKQVEDAVLGYVERDLICRGYDVIVGEYIETARNAPVETLFDRLGYVRLDEQAGDVVYQLELRDAPERALHVKGVHREC